MWFTDANCAAAAIREHAIVAWAVDMDFPSGHVRLSTYIGDLSIGGNTFSGIGSVAEISGEAMKTQLVADRRTYSLSGIDPTIVPESELDNCLGRSVIEYEVWIDPATRTVIGYETNWEGTMSNSFRRDGTKSPVITVFCESRLVVLEDSDDWRYTSEHQAKFFAGDTGLDQVKENDSVDIIWGGYRVFPGIGPHLARRILDN